MLDVKIINPFINSLHNVMHTMLGIAPEQASPYIKKDTAHSGDISGVIGFTDKSCKGSVTLSFPTATALQVYNLLTGESTDRLTREVQDTIGEMANMVAGGAKTELSTNGLTFFLSIPTIVIGQSHSMSRPPDIPVVVVPMSLEGKNFAMEIGMKIEENPAKR